MLSQIARGSAGDRWRGVSPENRALDVAPGRHSGTVAPKPAQWREIAQSNDVGLSDAERVEFAAAFHHDEARGALALAR